MQRELTPWEARLLAGLQGQVAGRTLKALAERWGMPYLLVYRILAERGGIGPRALEQLRQAEPDLVAGAFVPPGCLLVRAEPGAGPFSLPPGWTTVHDETGAGRQPDPGNGRGPCAEQ